MKKIYWWIQQINRIGGTEMVTIDLANSLCDKYDITLVSTVKIDGEIPYKIDPRIKVISMGIPTRCERFDFLSKKYLSHFRIFSYLGLVLQEGWHFVLRRRHYAKQMEKRLLEEDATLICSSVDTYSLAPKKGRVFFHYHFDVKTFFGQDSFFIKHSRKPDKFIFLSRTILEEITAKRPDLAKKSTYIYNPIRFESLLDTNYKNNTIVFVGRLAEQKNPLLALAIAEELKNRNFPFHLNMFGDGPIKNDVVQYHKDHQLEDVVTIHGFTNDVHKEILNSDFLLLTSRYEGFCLVMGEANALSRPWVTTDFGNSLNEQLVKDRNGIVINSENPSDFADAIIDLLSDKDRLANLKMTSYQESKKLSKDIIIPQWIKVIEE